ncbi:hypothetical protein [Lactococcus phage Nocturne116]|nr:hypothetical protein [Lactococcus phage Nocturne116]
MKLSEFLKTLKAVKEKFDEIEEREEIEKRTKIVAELTPKQIYKLRGQESIKARHELAKEFHESNGLAAIGGPIHYPTKAKIYITGERTYKRKKYTDIKAFKWTGPHSVPSWFYEKVDNGEIEFFPENGRLLFHTKNGEAHGKIGDMIVLNGQGCSYPVLPDVFAELYEEV